MDHGLDNYSGMDLELRGVSVVKLPRLASSGEGASVPVTETHPPSLKQTMGTAADLPRIGS